MPVSHVGTHNNGGQASSSPSIAGIDMTGADFCWVAVLYRGTFETVDSITVGGVEATKTAGQIDVGGCGISGREGYLLAPSGTVTVAATISVAPSMCWIIVKKMAGVHQTSPYATSPAWAATTGATSTANTIALPTDGMLLDAIYTRDQGDAATITPDAGQTSDFIGSEVGFGSTLATSRDATNSNTGWSGFNGNTLLVTVALAAAGEPQGDPGWNLRYREMRPAPFKPGRGR